MSSPDEEANPEVVDNPAADAADAAAPVDDSAESDLTTGLKQRKSRTDSGEKKVSRKKSGERKKDKDDFVLDPNAPQSIHRGFSCDKCAMQPILGTRWQKRKDNYDLCEACYIKLPEDKKRTAKGNERFTPKHFAEGQGPPIEVENPFLGWAGWPPMSTVIVSLILFGILEVAFAFLFHQFWTSGPEEDDVEQYFNCTHSKVEFEECMASAFEKNLTSENYNGPEGEFRCPLGCQIKIDHMYDVCDRMFASASNTTLTTANWTETAAWVAQNVTDYGCSGACLLQPLPLVAATCAVVVSLLSGV